MKGFARQEDGFEGRRVPKASRRPKLSQNARVSTILKVQLVTLGAHLESTWSHLEPTWSQLGAHLE